MYIDFVIIINDKSLADFPVKRSIQTNCQFRSSPINFCIRYCNVTLRFDELYFMNILNINDIGNNKNVHHFSRMEESKLVTVDLSLQPRTMASKRHIKYRLIPTKRIMISKGNAE